MSTNLHPYFRRLLANSAPTDMSGGPIAVAERRREELRHLMNEAPRAPVERVLDLEIPAKGRSIRARMYYPHSHDSHPLLTIYAHGGGWIAGDLETHDSICRRLTNASQNAVLAVDYRLAPENPYPAALDDTVSALVWSLAAGRDLKVNTSPGIALAGESSGANLMLATLLAVDAEVRETIRAAVLTHPPLQTRVDLPSHRDYGVGYGLTLDVIRYLWDVYIPRKADRRAPTAAPLEAESFAGVPRTLIQLAEFDPLRSEGEELAARMRSEGLAATSEVYRAVPHGFQTAFHHVPQAAQSIDDAAAFLRR